MVYIIALAPICLINMDSTKNSDSLIRLLKPLFIVKLKGLMVGLHVPQNLRFKQLPNALITFAFNGTII